MPISQYYKGHGELVMSNMQKEYGRLKGTRLFYAVANKRNLKPKQQFLHQALAVRSHHPKQVKS